MPTPRPERDSMPLPARLRSHDAQIELSLQKMRHRLRSFMEHAPTYRSPMTLEELIDAAKHQKREMPLLQEICDDVLPMLPTIAKSCRYVGAGAATGSVSCLSSSRRAGESLPCPRRHVRDADVTGL